MGREWDAAAVPLISTDGVSALIFAGVILGSTVVAASVTSSCEPISMPVALALPGTVLPVASRMNADRGVIGDKTSAAWLGGGAAMFGRQTTR
jgi:hypothetical protein